MQDNNPKHTSVYAADFMAEKSCSKLVEDTSRIPNPIENLWHELKGIHQETKPKTKEELIKGRGVLGECYSRKM